MHTLGYKKSNIFICCWRIK